MARFSGVCESAAALGTGINSASATVGGLFLNIRLNAASAFRLRRLTVGIRAGATAPTSQQLSFAIIRSSAAGAGATAQVLNQLDPNSFATNVRADVTGWTTTPTIPGNAQASYLYEATLNTQSAADLPWELTEEVYVNGSGNGLAFYNLANALPANHLYTVSYEVEELCICRSEGWGDRFWFMQSITITKRDGTTLHVLVSPEDYEDAVAVRWHMAGGKGPEGKYARSAEHGYLHRWIAVRMGLIATTEPEPGMRGRWSVSIDHKNGDKLDCRRQNLRLRDRPQQMSNPNDGLRKTNTSGFRGVTRMPGRKRPWNASVTESGRNVNLGYFFTPEEAAAARRSYDEATDKAAWLASRRPRDTGASGIRGVIFSGGRFIAHVNENGCQVTFGCCKTPEEALALREEYLALPPADREAWLKARATAPQANGSSGYRGVSFLKQVRERPWLAYATEAGRRHNLGRHATAEEAAAARRAWDEGRALAPGQGDLPRCGDGGRH